MAARRQHGTQGAWWRVLVAVGVLSAVVGTLSSAPRAEAAGRDTHHVHLSTAFADALGAGHACVVGPHTSPWVDWSALDNPIVSYAQAGVKDEALVYAARRWHILFSYVTEDPGAPGGVRWNIAGATSTDLAQWVGPSIWPDQPGVLGVASPDITEDPSGGFVVTYQSDPGQSDRTQARLYYRTTSDLVHYSAPHALAATLAPRAPDRMIDGALAWIGHGVILGYKAGSQGHQSFEIAWSPSGSLAGPWKKIGAPALSLYHDTVENYEFVVADGRWRLVATSNQLDQPWIFTLVGNPTRPASWLHWTAARQLQIPGQSWNSGPGLSSVSFEHANSAYLCDATAADGYYYLVYAGSSELTQFGGWGHAMIGVARSTDLLHWQPAG